MTFNQVVRGSSPRWLTKKAIEKSVAFFVLHEHIKRILGFTDEYFVVRKNVEESKQKDLKIKFDFQVLHADDRNRTCTVSH